MTIETPEKFDVKFDIATSVHPRGADPRQVKLYLSQRSYQTLKNASRRSGFDMSQIVDGMIATLLSADAPRSLRLQPGPKKRVNMDI